MGVALALDLGRSWEERVHDRLKGLQETSWMPDGSGDDNARRV